MFSSSRSVWTPAQYFRGCKPLEKSSPPPHARMTNSFSFFKRTPACAFFPLNCVPPLSFSGLECRDRLGGGQMLFLSFCPSSARIQNRAFRVVHSSRALRYFLEFGAFCSRIKAIFFSPLHRFFSSLHCVGLYAPILTRSAISPFFR